MTPAGFEQLLDSAAAGSRMQSTGHQGLGRIGAQGAAGGGGYTSADLPPDPTVLEPLSDEEMAEIFGLDPDELYLNRDPVNEGYSDRTHDFAKLPDRHPYGFWVLPDGSFFSCTDVFKRPETSHQNTAQEFMEKRHMRWMGDPYDVIDEHGWTRVITQDGVLYADPPDQFPSRARKTCRDLAAFYNLEVQIDRDSH